jgi:quercetin dioxygenase-like cupin family protein
MPELIMSLFQDTLRSNQLLRLDAPHAALWPMRGQVSCHGNVLSNQTGHLFSGPGPVEAGPEGSTVVRFIVGKRDAETCDGSQLISSKPLVAPAPRMLLRLDKVSFPPGATAWRHVHAGPGFRHLIKGRLRLETDDYTKSVHAGDSWFEAANSPVRATASENFSETAFIRLLLLPIEFAGKRTIHILSEEDQNRERRQTTTTYFDVPVDV